MDCSSKNTISNNDNAGKGLNPLAPKLISYKDDATWVDVELPNGGPVNQLSFLNNLQPIACPLKTCYLKIDNCGVAYTAGNLRVNPDAPYKL